jgi:hypothetical protein
MLITIPALAQLATISASSALMLIALDIESLLEGISIRARTADGAWPAAAFQLPAAAGHSRPGAELSLNGSADGSHRTREHKSVSQSPAASGSQAMSQHSRSGAKRRSAQHGVIPAGTASKRERRRKGRLARKKLGSRPHIGAWAAMPSEIRTHRLAVLIDADNASPRIADGLFEEIAKIGDASVRRIYGDFSGTRLKSWADILGRHAILPHQNFANTTGKNASDIALVIDAMDLLHSGRFDGFCLVSSDSDFTRLAGRIREQAVDVYGFGEQKTPESFRQACHRFIYTENLLPEAPAPDEPDRADQRPKSVTRPPALAVPLIRRAIGQLEDEEGWVSLGGVGQRLAALASDFDPRTFGEAKLADLVQKTGAFEVRRSGGRGVHIRVKP